MRNLGGETWPPAHHAAPLIRLAYRWLSADGTETVVPEGLRTPFEEAVAPGQETVVMLAVEAPETPGDHVLEVDVVHEHVRWFGAAARLAVAVEPADGAPAGSRLADDDRGPAARAQSARTRCRQATACAATTRSGADGAAREVVAVARVAPRSRAR